MPDLAPTTGPAAVRTLYLDVKDLVQYAEKISTLSGIQRVTVNLLNDFQACERAYPGTSVRFVVPEYSAQRLLAVDRAAVLDLVGLLESRSDDRETLRAVVQRIYASRALMRPVAGDIYLMTGTFWLCENFSMLATLRRRGVLFGLFIHDLIPIRHPEFVFPGATEAFREGLVSALTAAQFVMTNSAYVAADVEDFFATQLNFGLPVRAVPLATELPPEVPTFEPVESRAAELRDFVLCVGTIEIRKNHMFLIRIWERLIAAGVEDLPDLVFAGRWGWRVEDLKELVRSGNALGGKLHVLDGVSETTLRHLYKTCLLTAYPSFAEGFGLPIGESLAYGKPCVAARSTSLPEVGGEWARYVDPFDDEAGFRLFQTLLSDRPAIERWAVAIREGYRPRTWRAFTADFYATTLDLAGAVDAEDRDTNCVLDPSVLYRPATNEAARQHRGGLPLIVMRMACVSGWHPFELWGCWAGAPDARIRFKTRLAEGTAILVRLELNVPVGARSMPCGISVGGMAHTVWPGPLPRIFALEGLVGPAGVVEIALTARQAVTEDLRRLYIGLRSFAWCPRSEEATCRGFRRAARRTLARAPLGVVVSFLHARTRWLRGLATHQRVRPQTVGSIAIDLGAGRTLKVDGQVDAMAFGQMLDELERRLPE